MKIYIDFQYIFIITNSDDLPPNIANIANIANIFVKQLSIYFHDIYINILAQYIDQYRGGQSGVNISAIVLLLEYIDSISELLTIY